MSLALIFGTATITEEEYEWKFEMHIFLPRRGIICLSHWQIRLFFVLFAKYIAILFMYTVKGCLDLKVVCRLHVLFI